MNKFLDTSISVLWMIHERNDPQFLFYEWSAKEMMVKKRSQNLSVVQYLMALFGSLYT